MRAARKPHPTPIPGYRLLEPLGRGGFGEVWKCEAPGGLFKAVKFVYGTANALEADNARADEELQAVERVKAIRHPFILSMDRVELIGGDLVIIMELADKSLHDLLEEYQRVGLRGIPRDDLLGYLREAAEALDLMNGQHGLQHLDVKPRNLFLVSNHVKVGDFGLVNSLAALNGAAAQLGAITPLYASPEAFQGIISPHCDQYSLAVVYQELLSGTLPFTGKNARQLLMQHTHASPDLAPVPEADRPALARALAKDPHQRFACCTELVQRLAAASRQAVSVSAREGNPSTRGPAAETLADLGLAATPSAGPDSEEAVTVTFRRGGRPVRKLGDSNPPPRHEALPGYHFLERLGTSPVAEVWNARAPDGRTRHVKLLYGFVRQDGSEWAAIARLAALRHPGLVPAEVHPSNPGCLTLVTESVSATLRDRFQECQAQGLPGIPRRELLAHLAAAAEALDALYQQQALQHLGLNPRSLLLDGGRLRIADFGLAQLLWLPAGQAVAQLNARYAAPELFERYVSRGCDQYSLALIYQAMLTGTHPTAGRARGRRTANRSHWQPDLGPLPAADRAAVARALDPDPQERWDSCTELVRALEAAGGNAALAPASAGDLLGHLLASAASRTEPTGPQAPLPLPQDGDFLQQRCTSKLPPGGVRAKLDAFRQQWNGVVVQDDEQVYVFRMKRALSFWQRYLGRQTGLTVYVHRAAPADGSAATSHLTLHLRPFGCGRAEGGQLLKTLGPLLLDSAANCFQVTVERRGQERLAWQHLLQVRFVLPGGKLGKAVMCRAKDLSLTGVGFFLPSTLPTTQVCVELTAPDGPPVTVHAHIVRVQRYDDTCYEVGAVFC